MNKIDIFELGKAYFGVILITIDGCLGWHVTNYIINIISGRWLF